MDETFDPYFDFRAECPGRDIDSYSPTVKRYHRLLWSKPLPSGIPFDLVAGVAGSYLRHESALGSFALASDQIIRTFEPVQAMSAVISLLSQNERDDFLGEGASMAGLTLFPVGEGYTVNQARGTHPRIRDRFDLTLECIRLHYLGRADSPLGETLARYRGFFALFGDFRGYVDFFLFQDIVTPDYGGVSFFSPWDDFSSSPLPPDVDAYRAYRSRTIDFVHARNARIVDFVASA